ncbi:helix-turn-helix domain-containing protein [Edaphobacter sp.]|uniref:helix-turn-helix domain-containing protein n=1 Tax=Edaphobacter sp. TaxID=1934404 RepID=UPI00345B6010
MDSTLQDTLHNAESAAAILRVSPSTIRYYWTTGRLPRLKIGKHTRVRESELLKLIEEK